MEHEMDAAFKKELRGITTNLMVVVYSWYRAPRMMVGLDVLFELQRVSSASHPIGLDCLLSILFATTWLSFGFSSFRPELNPCET